MCTCVVSRFQAVGSTWYEDFTYCKDCNDLRQKGNYCPACLECYQDSDYESKVRERERERERREGG